MDRFIVNGGSDIYRLPSLSSMHLTLYSAIRPQGESFDERDPFYSRIGDVPRFFEKIAADKLGTLVLRFDHDEATEEPLPFLEELRKLRDFMETTLLQRCPHLRTITMDIGCPVDKLLWWKGHLTESWPQLFSKGMLDVVTTGMRKCVFQYPAEHIRYTLTHDSFHSDFV